MMPIEANVIFFNMDFLLSTYVGKHKKGSQIENDAGLQNVL